MNLLPQCSPPPPLALHIFESDSISSRICLKCGKGAPTVRFYKNRNVCNRCRGASRNRTKECAYGLKYRQKYPWRTLLMHARKRAKKLGLAYDLDDHLETLKARIMAMQCEITGVKLIPGSGCGSQGKRAWNTVSLDRMNPNCGYTIDNVRVVCWAINAAMGTWGEEVLRDLIAAWQTKEAM